MTLAPLCPYCRQTSELVPDAQVYKRSYGGMVYLCRPCNAWVGTHKGSKNHEPLGRLANAELRALKIQAHAAFDPLWRAAVKLRKWSIKKARGKAYSWLAEQTGMERKDCHIGMMDEAQCQLVIEVCRNRKRTSEEAA